MDAIFLSAGVPDPKRRPEYARTADTIAIQAAVSALVYVTLGRRLLVWGGQPGITPMVWVVASDMGLDYGGWVRLHQSRHFQEDFPEENARFGNVAFSENIEGDRSMSLLAMRRRMFTEHKFSAAVFIGGMEGIVEEYDLLTELQPDTTILPIVSTGGATLEIAERLAELPDDLFHDRDYVALMHRRLGIPVAEARYPHPDQQPTEPRDRIWRRD